MDMETPNTQESRLLNKWDDSSFLRQAADDDVKSRFAAVNQAASTHGMPWKTSVDPSYNEEHQRKRHHNSHASTSSCLLYMPFWEWQLAYMKEHLTNLRPLPVVDCNGNDMSYAESKSINASRGGMRMHTVQFASDEYKLIRMTTVDGGHQTQVFTSVWYPDLKYNMPILGIDLLQFGCGSGGPNTNNNKRTLCLMDFQSLHDREEDHDCTYEHLLSLIRNQYPSLQGEISNRFYNSNEFFSKQMLVGRCHVNDKTDCEKDSQQQWQQHEALIYNEMYPAFQQYMQTHVFLIKDSVAAIRARQSPKETSTRTMARVLQRHKDYDVYSSARDPAKGLLSHHFGKDFAHSYVHDILFPLSRTSESDTKCHNQPI